FEAIKNGYFVQSKYDHSLTVKETRDVFVALLVYVDDIVITGNCKVSSYKEKCLWVCGYDWDLSCFLKNEFKVSELFPVEVFNDSSSAIQIASNPLFQEKTKHFEIDVHLVGGKVLAGVIKTVKIHNSDQIVDIFTKGFSIGGGVEMMAAMVVAYVGGGRDGGVVLGMEMVMGWRRGGWVIVGDEGGVVEMELKVVAAIVFIWRQSYVRASGVVTR
ncbi:hypothetical protein Tco_0277974, partial [Tanacetum coccineum]